MAKLAPPPKTKGGVNTKGAPPKEENTVNNLHKTSPNRTKDMSFKVPYEFWKDYKMSALEEGMSMVEYIKLTHNYYKKHRNS